jgi:hypothetical protein
MPTNIFALHAQKASSLSWFAQAIKDPNLTVLFSVLGLAITGVAISCFPNLGVMMAQHNQF